MRALSLILLSALSCFESATVSAQTADRTIDEIKTETLARAQTGAYPALGIQPADASERSPASRARDPDEWAAAWSAVADSIWLRPRQRPAPERPTQILSGPGACIISANGRRRLPPASRPPISEPSMPTCNMPDISIRRSKSYTFPTGTRKLSAT